jgi:hypothetical protein
MNARDLYERYEFNATFTYQELLDLTLVHFKGHLDSLLMHLDSVAEEVAELKASGWVSSE